MIKLFRAILVLFVMSISIAMMPSFIANAQVLNCTNYKEGGYKQGESCKKPDGTYYNITTKCVQGSLPPAGEYCYSVASETGSTSDGGNASEVRQATGVQAPVDNSPSSLNLCKETNLLAKIPCEMWAFVSTIVLTIITSLTVMTATIFDYVVKAFVLDIATFFTSTNPNKDYIYSAWTVIRDLGNIIAFFGAVYMGFRYIIGKDDLDFKKAVMKLVFYSLMVNFSFPIAKFLIDISNVVSLQIYGGFTKYNIGGGELKNMIMESIGVTGLSSEVGKIETIFGQFNSFTVLWLAIIYMFLTFGVFLYASLQIIIRAFILIACVIFSPIMFLNFAFPKITELHEKWRENFFGQLIFMPMLMIGFWLSFTLLGATSAGQESIIPNNTESTLMPIVNMSLAIVALIMGIKLSSAASGSVGKYASGVVGGAMKEVGLGVATGGGSALARMSIGKMGSKMAASKWVTEGQGKENGTLRRMSASMLKNVGGKMSGFSAFGKDSYKVKTEKTLEKEKLDLKNTNFEGLKDTGLTKLLDEAKTPEEVAKVKAEMEHRLNGGKSNTDVLGRAEAKRKFDAQQNKLREARQGGVASSLRTKFFEEKDSIEKEKKDLENLTKLTSLNSDQSAEKDRLEAKIKEREEKIETELKGSSLAYKIGSGLGSSTGDVKVGVSKAKDTVLDATGITGGIRNTKAFIDKSGKAIANFADRPSIVTVTKEAAAKSFRDKTAAREAERAQEIKKMDEDKADYKNEGASKVVAGGNDDGKVAASANSNPNRSSGLSVEA